MYMRRENMGGSQSAGKETVQVKEEGNGENNEWSDGEQNEEHNVSLIITLKHSISLFFGNS